jgi:steroid delta-isomerase-like uncharacterized protein
MSTAIVEAYYRAFNIQDAEGMLALLSDDVVHDVNQGDREQGKAAFRAFLGRMEAAYEEQLKDVVVMGDATGTRFAAEFVVHGRYLKADPGFPAAHGQRYVLSAGAFLEVRGGQITRVTTFYNLADWLKQVGG